MQRYFAQEKNNSYFRLSEEDCYHIETVMRMKDGDQIEVVYNETVYLCCLENVNRGTKILIEKERVKKEEYLPKVILCIPLLKEQKMDYILQKATELGVSEVIPIALSRSIIKVDDKKIGKKIERWQKICKEASEQSMRVKIPVIRSYQQIQGLAELEGTKIVCSTREKQNSIKNLLQSDLICDTLVVVIGPEGGLSEQEEEKLVELGFEQVSLGARILRVETVPLYLLSILNYKYME